MSLMLYSIFDKVVQTGNFQKAADALNFTPSAISHAIARLEARFGFRLLLREKGGIALTSQGEQLLPYIRSVLEWENSTQLIVKQLNNMEAGVVRLGIFNSFSNTWIPDIVQIFHDRFPKIRLYIVEGNYREQEAWLLSSKLDIAFICMPVDEKLCADALFEDRLMCITPPEFRPENGTVMTASDLSDQTFVLANELYECHLAQFFRENDISIRYEQTINSDYSIMAMVAGGFGISILPEVALADSVADINVYPIENGPSRTIGIATRSPDFVSPATAELKSIIIDYSHRLKGNAAQ